MEATQCLSETSWLHCVSCQVHVAGGKVQASHDFVGPQIIKCCKQHIVSLIQWWIQEGEGGQGGS